MSHVLEIELMTNTLGFLINDQSEAIINQSESINMIVATNRRRLSRYNTAISVKVECIFET